MDDSINCTVNCNCTVTQSLIIFQFGDDSSAVSQEWIVTKMVSGVGGAEDH